MQRRRRFLKVLAASPLAALACGGAETFEEGDDPANATATTGGAGGGGSLPAGYLEIGLARDIPVDTLLAHPTLDVFVGRDAGGIYVMTSRCTHQDCNMIGHEGVAADLTVTCGCHGSRFDRFGQVEKGPANETLPHFHVIVADGVVAAHLGQTVDVAFRAPVP